MNNLIFDEKAFWLRLKKLSHERNIQQKKYCEDLGFNVQVFRNKITRNTYPTIEQLVKLAQYFEVSVEYLLFGVDRNPYQKENEILKQKIKAISEIISN